MRISSHGDHESTVGAEYPFSLHNDKLAHDICNEYNSKIPLFCPSLQKDECIRV